VGAWALAFHGRPRYTGDLDIFIKRDPPNAERMQRVIQDFGFGNIGITREDFLKKDYVIQLGIAPNRIDLLTGISGIAFEDAWQARTKGNLAGQQAWFISRDHLIQNKKASNRDKDLSDIRLLEKNRLDGP
jgi:hypothetical protein